MSPLDFSAPLRLLRLGYQPDDWVAIFLKSYTTGEVCQRVGPLSQVMTRRFQAWLRAKNAAGWNVYVGTNAVTPGRRSRVREDVRAVRHVFLDADQDGPHVLAQLANRGDLPAPSYLLHSSWHRVHICWRVAGFDLDTVEALQRQLAGELGTDPAATAASQLTRLPGFFNHKYLPPYLVTMVYGSLDRVCTPDDFPAPAVPPRAPVPRLTWIPARLDRARRARAWLAAVPPAIAGQHGDVHTFKVCCRLTRGFALDDEEAVALLAAWNARCAPPWSEHELRDKLRRARRYGREPIGGLLAASL